MTVPSLPGSPRTPSPAPSARGGSPNLLRMARSAPQTTVSTKLTIAAGSQSAPPCTGYFRSEGPMIGEDCLVRQVFWKKGSLSSSSYRSTTLHEPIVFTSSTRLESLYAQAGNGCSSHAGYSTPSNSPSGPCSGKGGSPDSSPKISSGSTPPTSPDGYRSRKSGSPDSSPKSSSGSTPPTSPDGYCSRKSGEGS